MANREIVLVYDEECPVCDAYCHVVRLRESVGELQLVNAREDTTVMKDITRQGLDVDQGMVLKVDARFGRRIRMPSAERSKVQSPRNAASERGFAPERTMSPTRRIAPYPTTIPMESRFPSTGVRKSCISVKMSTHKKTGDMMLR
jgi:hypothetical protein